MNDHKIRILLVEDDEVDIIAIKRLIRDNNLPYDLNITESFGEGIARIKNEKFDVILSDHNLGDGFGLDLLKEATGTPTIMITGSGDEEIAAKAVRMGIYDYLVKDPERNYLKVLPTTVQAVMARKRAEDNLETTRALLEKTLASLDEAIMVVDAETSRIVSCNPAAERIFGYMQDEIIGASLELFHIDNSSYKEFTIRLFSSLDSNGVFNAEFPMKRKNGGIFPTELTVTQILGESGKRVSLVIATRDITDRKEAEKALRSRTDLIRLQQEVAEAANEALTVDNVMLVCLEKVCRHTGWEVGHVYMPDSGGKLIPTDLWYMDNPIRFQTFRDITQSTVFASGEGLPGRVFKSGQPAWITDVYQDSNFPRAKQAEHLGVKAGFAFPALEKKEVIAVLEFFTTEQREPDESLISAIKYLMSQIGRVTERKRAEEALKESEEKFRSAFEDAAIGVVIAGLDGSFVKVNSAFCQMTGYSEKELIGKAFEDITHPDDLAADKYNVMRVLSREIDSFHMEKRYIHKDGHLIWVSLNVSVVAGEDDMPLYFIGQIQNTTDRKKAEEELKESREQALEATKLKDKFISLVAHDLRSPFTTILGLLKIVRYDKDLPLNPEQKEMLTSALDNCERALGMIDGLLNISRFQTGTIKPNPEFIDGRDVAASAAGEASYAAMEKGVKLVNDVPDGARLYADKELFGEVIKNLVTNAIKFSQKGDQITIYIPDDCKTAIAVRDEGVGVDKDLLPKLFKYEEKTSTSGTSGETGTGLGLPLSHDIMSALGGTLEAKTFEGKGSEFTAKLPHVQPRILFADDEPIAVKKIARMLESIDTEVVMAADGAEALNMAMDNRPDLIILDLFMPNMDGFEFLKKMKKSAKLENVPVIAITAHGEMENRERAFRLGADDFVTKPTTPEDLLPRVRKHIY